MATCPGFPAQDSARENHWPVRQDTEVLVCHLLAPGLLCFLASPAGGAGRNREWETYDGKPLAQLDKCHHHLQGETNAPLVGCGHPACFCLPHLELWDLLDLPGNCWHGLMHAAAPPPLGPELLQLGDATSPPKAAKAWLLSGAPTL